MQITYNHSFFNKPCFLEILPNICDTLDPWSILKIAQVNKSWNTQISSFRKLLLSFKQFPQWFHFKPKEEANFNSFEKNKIFEFEEVCPRVEELCKLYIFSRGQYDARMKKLTQELKFTFNVTCYGVINSNSIEAGEIHHTFPIENEEICVTTFSKQKFARPVHYIIDQSKLPFTPIKFSLYYDFVSLYYEKISNLSSMRLRAIQLDSDPDPIEAPIKKAIEQFNQIIESMNHKEDEKYFNSL